MSYQKSIPMWHYEEMYRLYKAARGGKEKEFACMLRTLVENGWGSLTDDLDKQGCLKILWDIEKEKK